MTARVVALQLVSWLRDARLLGLLAAMMLALGVAASWATAADVSRQEAQVAAASAARDQWEGRGAAHPHSMAHFGDFAFRPSGSLARLDRGVQARLGKVVRVEGHHAGTPVHTDAARAGTVARFSPPDAAFLLQTVVPLLLVFLGATGLASDRASGRLKLALVQGVEARALVFGHMLALWGLGLVLVALVLVASLATSALLGAELIPSVGRLVGFAIVHATHLAVVSTGVVAAAVWSRSARSALLVLLAAWVVGTAVLPRATASVATAAYPLPSQDAFQASLKAAKEAGPDGHNPQDSLLAERRQEVLAEHGVETVEELPFNFDGIAMQIGEDFGDRVWDEHAGALRARLEQQAFVGSLAAVLNPFQAVDHLSMALAGTDLAHDLDFRQQAEQYRRQLIAALNHEHAYGGSRAGERGWTASAEFYEGLAPFTYVPPALTAGTRHRQPEVAGLVLWLLGLLGLLVVGAGRLERGQLPC